MDDAVLRTRLDSKKTDLIFAQWVVPIRLRLEFLAAVHLSSLSTNCSAKTRNQKPKPNPRKAVLSSYCMQWLKDSLCEDVEGCAIKS
jgi:hypothetical protein